MKKFFSRYWIFILLATIATILVGFYLKNKVFSPYIQEQLLPLPSPKIESYSISTIPNLSQLEKNFPLFNHKISVYQVGFSSLSDQKAILIAEKFGFSAPPIVLTQSLGETSYNWDTEENNLSINLRRGEINYSLNILGHPEFIKGELPLLSEVKEKIESFLKENSLFPPEGINLGIKEVFYVKNFFPYFEKVNEKEKADLIQIKLEYQINKNKVVAVSDYPPSISIFIGPEFKIVLLNYYLLCNKIELLKEVYPLKTKDEILKNIKTNPRISYLSISTGDNPTSSLEEQKQLVTNLSFDNIELVYYKYDPLQSYLQPVFLITGKATLKDGTQAEAGLYLPAIKDEYLLK